MHTGAVWNAIPNVYMYQLICMQILAYQIMFV